MAELKTPEQRAKNTQQKREWRLKNPERAREINRAYNKRYPERVAQQQKKYQQKNKEKIRKRLKIWFEVSGKKRKYALQKYNLTPEGYEEILKKQNGLCLICGVDEHNLKRRLVVDHCHTSNKVRGLLCVNCNLLIGYADDDETILENAIYYLREHYGR